MKISIRHRYVAKIPALEVVIEEQKDKTLPLIVYYHSWQSAKELSLTQARKLAHEGFRVTLPDAMNHGERKTGPISTVPPITSWGSIQYNLIEFPVITHHFRKLGLIKENWTDVGGVSIGGITTSAPTTQRPEIQAVTRSMGTPCPVYYIQRMIQRAKGFATLVPRDLPLLLGWVYQYDLPQTPEKLQERPVLFWYRVEDGKIPYEDMADFEQPISGKAYAKNTQFITETGERYLVKGETVDLAVDSFEEASKASEK